MPPGSVLVIRGPARDIDCDAWIEPVGRTGLNYPGDTDRFLNPEYAAREARKLATGATRPAVSILKGREELSPMRALIAADLTARSEHVSALTEAFSAAIRAVEARFAELGRVPRSTGMRIAIPCPSTSGWFSRFSLTEGARRVLQAAKQAAERLHAEVVLVIDDGELYEHLQAARAALPYFWWPALGRGGV